MARVLMNWELGSGLGHLLEIKPLAMGLLEAGHEVTLAVKDFTNVDRIFSGTGVRYLPVPARTSPVPDSYPILSTFPQILYNVGFGDLAGLQAQVAAWRTLFEYVQPDLIVANYSPTAMLAARCCSLRVVTLGTGFACAAACEQFPDWRPELGNDPRKLLAAEQIVLNHANAVLQRWNQPPFQVLSELYQQVEDTLLVSYAELDPYQDRTSASYSGTWPESPGKEPNWPKGGNARALVYLRPLPGIEKILALIKDLELAAILRIPGVNERLTREFDSPLFCWAHDSLDFKACAEQCDLGIGHATHGMSVSLLFAGKPNFMLPPYLEHGLNAQGVMKLGAGIAANLKAKGTDPLRKPLVELLTEKKYQIAAMKFSTKYAAIDRQQQVNRSIARLVELLE